LAGKGAERTMSAYVVWVEFDIHADMSAAFVAMVRENATISLASEPGCERFDVLCSEADPSHIALYEVYGSRPAFEDHLGSPHFRDFDMRSQPLVSRKQVSTFVLG
jgi:quinol monooxygenase YgiN